MSSFVRFVLLHKEIDDPVGDLARDILADPKVNRNWGYKRFVKHLEMMNASPRVFVIVDALEEYYRQMRLI